MELLILKQEIVDKVKEDQILYGKVAKALGIGAPSLIYLLRVNSTKLTQASVMMVLKDHLNIKKDSELLTEMQPV